MTSEVNSGSDWSKYCIAPNQNFREIAENPIIANFRDKNFLSPHFFVITTVISFL